MPVNNTHPRYDLMAPLWERVRDTLEGEDAIKAKRESYLPIPPGMSPGSNQLEANGKRATDDRYAFYLTFAEFPEVIAPAVNGFQGIIHEKPAKVTLPPAMEYLTEDATPDGEPLDVLWQRITREILSTGRISLVCDVGADDKIRIVSYSAEALINWRLQPIRQGGDPVFVVVQEAMEEQDENDEFKTKIRKVWRELRMVQEEEDLTPFYGVRTWIEPKDGGEPKPEEEAFTPILRFGEKVDSVPIRVINAIDTGFTYGPIPIMPLVRRALSIYRLTADYRRSLYIKGDPQPWITGVEAEDAPVGIGGATIWTFTDNQTKIGYLDVDGEGIPLTKEALDSEYERFHEEGGKLLSEADRGAESGEALRRRQIAKQVTLKGVVLNAADGLQAVLRKIADILSIDPETVLFVPDTDFSEPTMSGKELFELVTSKNAGAPLALSTIHDLARRGGLTEKEFEAEMDEIAAEEPIPNGLTPDDTDEEEETAATVESDEDDPVEPDTE